MIAMLHHFDTELDELKQQLLAMGGHAESAVQRSVQALVERDYDLATKVREGDSVLDGFEVKIDELAVNLLAKAPLATDLRLITVAMKVSQNLERVGDEACKIAKRAHELIQEPALKQVGDIRRLSEMVLQIVKGSLDSFVNQDPAAARALIPSDKQIDALNKAIHRDLARDMIERPDTITRCLNLMVVAKSLERIADHAKNIAEEVVYLKEAEDIRHARTRGVMQDRGGGEKP